MCANQKYGGWSLAPIIHSELVIKFKLFSIYLNSVYYTKYEKIIFNKKTKEHRNFDLLLFIFGEISDDDPLFLFLCDRTFFVYTCVFFQLKLAVPIFLERIHKSFLNKNDQKQPKTPLIKMERRISIRCFSNYIIKI